MGPLTTTPPQPPSWERGLPTARPPANQNRTNAARLGSLRLDPQSLNQPTEDRRMPLPPPTLSECRRMPCFPPPTTDPVLRYLLWALEAPPCT